MIFVDEIHSYPTAAIQPGARRCGAQWCHMTCDGDREELHRFAAQIGLKRAWFQDRGGVPHYDLVPRRREAALRAGAVFKSAREQARERLAQRRLL